MTNLLKNINELIFFIRACQSKDVTKDQEEDTDNLNTRHLGEG